MTWQLAYIPFLSPLPGGWDYWYLLLLPLGFLVALVYKAVRLDDLSGLMPATCRAFGKLVGVFVAIALGLYVLAWLLAR